VVTFAGAAVEGVGVCRGAATGGDLDGVADAAFGAGDCATGFLAISAYHGKSRRRP
jgi:hypothetical protein